MSIREKILKCELTVGTWLQSGSPVMAEIMADYGFDFISADMEHTDINEESFTHFARAIQGKAKAFARVRENDTISIRRLLDCGATGIIVPLVNNKAEAQKAVASAKYPPEGRRGFAFTRSNNWGKSFDDYAKNANESITVIVMIESREAVENIDEILSVDGVDGILIGPYDMSGSLGVVGQTAHPLVEEAKDKVLKACIKHKKAAGQHIVLPTKQSVTEAIEQGYTLLVLGMDTVFVAEGAKTVTAFA